MHVRPVSVIVSPGPELDRTLWEERVVHEFEAGARNSARVRVESTAEVTGFERESARQLAVGTYLTVLHLGSTAELVPEYFTRRLIQDESGVPENEDRDKPGSEVELS